MSSEGPLSSEQYILRKVHLYKDLLDKIFYGKHFLFKSFDKFLKQVHSEYPDKSDLTYTVVKWYYDNQAIVQIFKPFINNHVHVPIIANAPFSRVYMDTMYLTMNNSVFAFINVMDLFSKYAYSNLYVIGKKTSAVKSINALETFNDFLKEVGSPRIGTVITDQGGEFYGEFEEDLKKKKIPQDFADAGYKSKTSPIERFNKTLRLMLEKYKMVYGRLTQETLEEIIASYNNSEHSTLKYSPNEILSDVKAQRTVKQMYSTRKPETDYVPLTGYVRVKLETNIFSKTKPVWTSEIYLIKSFKDGKYTLDGSSGTFKGEELQPVQKEYLLNPKIKFADEEEASEKEVIPKVVKEIEKRETRGNRIDYAQIQGFVPRGNNKTIAYYV